VAQALTFDIKRYAINDGPGIRITIFLKGCPLSCAWCHNPESMLPTIQKLYTASKCIGCQSCVKVCPMDACVLTPKGIVTDPELCQLCGACAEACPTKAIEMTGKQRSVDELIAIIEKERPFFEQSGGGVTFSGGEPLYHADFLIEMLDACGERGFHRVVDTTGLSRTETLLKVAERTELFLYDLKHMDSAKHKFYCGVGNERILGNLTALADSGADIRIRMPLVGGVNDDDANLAATAAFVAGLSGQKKEVNLLPYHSIAVKKYEKLGRDYDKGEMHEPSKQLQQRAIRIFDQHGLTATIGG